MAFAYELEKGSKKHPCPRCGRRTFTRVMEIATGRYLDDHVGRCDRESSCGYQFTSKQYFADNTDRSTRRNASRNQPYKKERLREAGRRYDTGAKSPFTDGISAIKVDHLEITHLLETLGDYDRNSFIQFLSKLFPDDPNEINDAVKAYKIGTIDDWTSFPVISRQGNFCKAKLMKFDPANGKRIKDADGRGTISSLQARLKKAGRLKDDFETDKEVFFGEHLLLKYPDQPIAIVESEKTAVIASICKGAFPFEMNWLATGSKQWLKPDRIIRLGRDRKIILYPDADGFADWTEKALRARRLGMDVKVSGLIQNIATNEQKADQVDQADYLISEQRKRNDPARREAFRNLIEERMAILTVDGDMTECEAEIHLTESDFIEYAIRIVDSWV